MTGTDPIVERVRLGDLWRATPQSPALPAEDHGHWGPLNVHAPPYQEIEHEARARLRVELAVDGLSLELSDDALKESLAHYPTLVGGRSVRNGISPGFGSYYVTDRAQVAYARHARLLDLGVLRPWILRSPVLIWPFVGDGDAYERTLETLAPVPVADREDERIVFPAVGGSRASAYLALWWALFLALSSVVRYEPALWTAAIDPDRSTLAVPLEQVCDHAQTFSPLVLRTLLTRFD
jgi:hypothetical protein